MDSGKSLEEADEFSLSKALDLAQTENNRKIVPTRSETIQYHGTRYELTVFQQFPNRLPGVFRLFMRKLMKEGKSNHA